MKRESDLTRDVAPVRRRIYIACGVATIILALVALLGVGFNVISPSPTNYWVGGIVVIPMFAALGAAWFCDAPGESRTNVEKASELTRVWFLVTAISQVTWELPWLVGDVQGWMHFTANDHWGWYWWYYGVADTRYLHSDPNLWAMEMCAIIGGLLTLFAFCRLMTPAKRDIRQHIISLWIGFFGVAMLYTVLIIYYVSAIRAHFDFCEHTVAGMVVLFFIDNLPWILAPLIVIPSIPMQIDSLYRKLARQPNLSEDK